jgi:hypothetical protein
VRVRDELGRPDRRRLERQAAVLHARDQRERVDQAPELLGRLDHEREVPGVLALDRAEPLERAREAVGRRERGAQVMARPRDQLGKPWAIRGHGTSVLIVRSYRDRIPVLGSASELST